MSKLKKIYSTSKCHYCGHSPGDENGKEFVIYSKARAQWLEDAAKQLCYEGGDDSWVFWMDAGDRLSKNKE